MERAAWVTCDLVQAQRGMLPGISIVSGAPTSHRSKRWVQTSTMLSPRAAAAGRIGVRTTRAPVLLPLAPHEERGGGGCLPALAYGVLSVIAMGAGITVLSAWPHRREHDYRGVVPIAAVVFVIACAGVFVVMRGIYRRGMTNRVRVNRYGEFQIRTHPTFVHAITAQQQQAAGVASTPWPGGAGIGGAGGPTWPPRPT